MMWQWHTLKIYKHDHLVKDWSFEAKPGQHAKRIASEFFNDITKWAGDRPTKWQAQGESTFLARKGDYLIVLYCHP